NREINSNWDRWYCIHRCRTATYVCKSIEYRALDGRCQLSDKSKEDINPSMWSNFTEEWDFYERADCIDPEASVVRHANITGSKYGMLIYDVPIKVYDARIEYVENGLIFHKNSFGTNMTFRDSQISQSTGSGIVMTSSALRYIDMTGSVVDRARYHGILLDGDNPILNLINGTVSQSEKHGIYKSSSVSAASVSLDGVTFDSNRQNDLNIKYPKYISVLNCAFMKSIQSNYHAIYISKMGQYYDKTSRLTMDIKNSVFEENVGPVVKVTTNTHNHHLKALINIQNNVFRNNSNSLVEIAPSTGTDVLIQDNLMEYNVGTAHLIDIHAIYYQYGKQWLNNDVHIIRNKLLSNEGLTMVHLNPDDNAKSSGMLTDNVFSGNSASQGIIRTTSGNYSFHYNILENPSIAFELYVEYNGDDVVDATYNWWGSTTEAYAKDRIFDKEDAINSAVVVYIPILQGKVFTCFAVNNCSGHGECIRPDRCRCDDGWKGTECNQVSCQQVSNCYGNGNCVGPNVCECIGSWTGKTCADATCYSVNNCSSRGYCLQPDTCSCFSSYAGTDCSQCEDLYWGQDCEPCPPCINGYCNKLTGECTCSTI
ncbi:unnamed protein product, partial [Owenia fusiformis]